VFCYRTMDFAITITNQQALHAIRAVVSSMLATNLWESQRDTKRSKLSYEIEALRQDLIRRGDLLLAAVRLEQQFGGIDVRQAPDDELSAWKECQAAVERLTEEYGCALAVLHGEISSLENSSLENLKTP